jgi:hypothetical protein
MTEGGQHGVGRVLEQRASARINLFAVHAAEHVRRDARLAFGQAVDHRQERFVRLGGAAQPAPPRRRARHVRAKTGDSARGSFAVRLTDEVDRALHAALERALIFEHDPALGVLVGHGQIAAPQPLLQADARQAFARRWLAGDFA